jgi:hypothetical protein
MAGLVPAIPIIEAPYAPDRHRRDKPGDDELAATSFAMLHARQTVKPSSFSRCLGWSCGVRELLFGAFENAGDQRFGKTRQKTPERQQGQSF